MFGWPIRAAQRESMARPVFTEERTIDEVLLGTINAFAEAVEARDPYTSGHTWRVTSYALLIADWMGLTADEHRDLAIGGVLHDLGKIGIRDAVLNKPARLTNDELAHIREHPTIGARIVRHAAPLLSSAIVCVEGHHERWDGRGYPHHLSGQEIPRLARIMAVADAYDAITSSRPYHKGRASAEGLAEISRQRGTQFDPDVADAFLDLSVGGTLDNVWRGTAHGKLLSCILCNEYVMAPPPDALRPIRRTDSDKDDLHTTCPLCGARYGLAVRNGRLEVAHLDDLDLTRLADHAAGIGQDLPTIAAISRDVLATAQVADPTHLFERIERRELRVLAG